MSFHKVKLSTLLFILLLALSGASFGFLVGRSQQVRAEQAKEQFQLVGEKVQAGSTVVYKSADLIRRLLTN